MNHNIPPHASWYPSDILQVPPWCTEHTSYKVVLLLPERFAGATRRRTPRKNYATLDWLSTHCGLSQNLFLPCNTKFIIHLSTKNLHLFQANCAPQCSVLKKNACCLTLAISYFVLLSQPLFVPCLFEKVYWEGKHLAKSTYFQNHWGAQFVCKKCKSTSSNLKGRLLIYICNQFLSFWKDVFVFIVCDSLSLDICVYRTNQTSPEGFLSRN